MKYTTLPPSPEVAGAVEAYWAYQGYQPPHAFERIFPAGTVELVLNLTDGQLRCQDVGSPHIRELHGLVLTGVHRRPFVVDTAQQYSMLGIALKPGGLWRLLGIASDEFTDRHVQMEAVVGHAAQLWMESIWDAPDHRQRLRLLDLALCGHARETGRQLHPAVEWATQQLMLYPGVTRVADLADEAQLSTRRFNALFTREIGIGPKCFARIRRFQITLGQLRKGREVPWSELAWKMGYSDQAHLIRDFQEFGGLSPTQYQALQTSSLAHVPEAEADQMCPFPEEYDAMAGVAV